MQKVKELFKRHLYEIVTQGRNRTCCSSAQWTDCCVESDQELKRGDHKAFISQICCTGFSECGQGAAEAQSQQLK